MDARRFSCATTAMTSFGVSGFSAFFWIQIRGRMIRITDASERTNGRLLLETRYPFLKQLCEGPLALQNAYAQVEFYRLELVRLVLIDDSRGFGHKDTLELGETPADHLRRTLIIDSLLGLGEGRQISLPGM
jgi:hypothetical protein